MGLRRSRKKAGDPDQPPRPTAGPGAAGGPADSLIAAGMVLDGDCQTDGPLRVEGHIKGSVRAVRLAIGAGGRVDGDITGPDDGADHAFLIDGNVGGTVRAPRVEIGREGVVRAGVQAGVAVIRGRVVGAIAATDRLRIEETAVIEGDVTAPRLALEEGSRVVGAIRAGERPAGG